MRFTLVLIPLIAHIYVIASQNTIYNFGLCITGQLGRLQLESKVKFLLEPLILRRNNAIDIVLILEDNDELVYVNGHGDRQLLYNSSDEIVEGNKLTLTFLNVTLLILHSFAALLKKSHR
jgi:hypothetical protein